MQEDRTLVGALASRSLMHGPSYYSSGWILFGILLLLLAGGIVWIIYFATRKKHIKTIADLAPQAPYQVNIDELRKKYLNMVKQVEQRFDEKKIKASVAHQDLSLVVRYFYAEANGFHAEILTLGDLKKSRWKKLTSVVEAYYPDEFNMLEKGSVKSAADLASELIMNDEVLMKQINALSAVNKKEKEGTVAK